MTDKFYMVRNGRDFSIQKSSPSTITHKFIRIVPDTVNYILEEWVLISQYEIYCKVYNVERDND